MSAHAATRNNVYSSSSENTSIERSHSTTNTDTDTDSSPSFAFHRRNSLAALSVAAEPWDEGEPKWPSGWRPYTCLFGGFLLMFNSWGLVRYPIICIPHQHLLTPFRSTPTAHMLVSSRLASDKRTHEQALTGSSLLHATSLTR